MFKLPFIIATLSLFQLTFAGPLGIYDKIPSKQETSDVLKPKNVDMVFTSTLIRAVINEAQSLLNPCSLFDAVREDVRKSPQKTKSKMATSETSFLDVNRRMVLEMALPAIREGISLYRTMFILQETANLTVFLDQNRDEIYSNTSLRNYAHYYVRAANDEITQILFMGLIKNNELAVKGTEVPAMEFLSANGLINHPRQYVGFETIPQQEAQLILEKRRQMADLLSSQGTYWEDDTEYLTSVMTAAFNGPEEDKEFGQILPKVIKNYLHKLLVAAPKLGDKYEAVCFKENSSKFQQNGPTVEAFAL